MKNLEENGFVHFGNKKEKISWKRAAFALTAAIILKLALQNPAHQSLNQRFENFKDNFLISIGEKKAPKYVDSPVEQARDHHQQEQTLIL